MIEVVDRQGWRKTFRVDKAIVRIGSESGNDIVLEPWRGAGLSSHHMQLICLPQADGLRRRLVNLGEAVVVVRRDGERTVEPRSVADLEVGDELSVGDFTITYHGDDAESAPHTAPASGEGMPSTPQAGAESGPTSAVVAGHPVPTDTSQDVPASREAAARHGQPYSAVIGLELHLEGQEIAPGDSLAGTVIVRNLGERTGAQFKLTVEGLDSGFYELGPGPILFPGAARELPIVFHHPRSTVSAGEHEVRVIATAPEAYPGDRAEAIEKIIVMPYYAHAVHLSVRR
ncbi:MAG: hypothetical protein GX620_09235 [Chloroflexi bacterium]|nr:hypothetical protein [Chloroflexota bacterium]